MYDTMLSMVAATVDITILIVHKFPTRISVVRVQSIIELSAVRGLPGSSAFA